MADHLQSCLACQAELAGYRRLLRVLRSLRDEPVLFPSPELIGDTLTALSERLVDRDRRLVDRDKRERWLIAAALVVLGVAAVGAGAGALVARWGGGRPATRSRPLSASCSRRPERDPGAAPGGIGAIVDPVGACARVQAAGWHWLQRAVAQFGRAPVSKTGGWGFKSLLPCSRLHMGRSRT